MDRGRLADKSMVVGGSQLTINYLLFAIFPPPRPSSSTCDIITQLRYRFQL